MKSKKLLSKISNYIHIFLIFYLLGFGVFFLIGSIYAPDEFYLNPLLSHVNVERFLLLNLSIGFFVGCHSLKNEYVISKLRGQNEDNKE